MSGNISLKPSLCNGKGGQDEVIFLMKFKAWGRTQGMGALFNVNFESTLPATEAAVSNLGDNTDKKKEDTKN